MKLLLDTCVWGGAKAELIALGHDVRWTGDLAEDPGDDEILKLAHSESRILVTLDKDFGELAIVRKEAHSGIMRLVHFPARDQGSICEAVLQQYGTDLLSGAIVTVEPGRIRIRPPDAVNE